MNDTPKYASRGNIGQSTPLNRTTSNETQSVESRYVIQEVIYSLIRDTWPWAVLTLGVNSNVETSPRCKLQ